MKPIQQGKKIGATYAPSPIFGAFKPSAKEAVKKPLAPDKPSSGESGSAETESKTGDAKEQKPKPPLTEDEKIVSS
jgi:hypothetical protein